MIGNIIKWSARILSILFILFISMFALDSSGIGFFIHLIPSYILVALLILSWFKPLSGGICFIILSGLFTYFFKTYNDIIVFLLISIPVLIIGILFIIQYYIENEKNNKIKKIRPKRSRGKKD